MNTRLRHGSFFGRLALVAFAAVAFAGPVYADDFVIQSASMVRYRVDLPREKLRAFDRPEFIARHLPGLKKVVPVGGDLYDWNLEIRVPLARPMSGTFLASRRALEDNRIVYESQDAEAQDYMKCETSVTAEPEGTSVIEIAIRLRFRRSNGWKFHWLAPVLGEKFLSGQVQKKLDAMLRAFVESSKKEWESSISPQPLSDP